MKFATGTTEEWVMVPRCFGVSAIGGLTFEDLFLSALGWRFRDGLIMFDKFHIYIYILYMFIWILSKLLMFSKFIKVHLLYPRPTPRKMWKILGGKCGRLLGQEISRDVDSPKTKGSKQV
jgi:hypothetical protein